MASIKDVAKKAQVGVATVSRALNDSGYVSLEARTKIDQAIKDLNYIPNELARNLYRNRTGIVGVVVPDLEHPFFAKLSKCLEMDLYDQGYKTMICNTVGISNREQDYLDMLERNMVDGIIAGAHTLDDDVYTNISKPIIALDHNFGEKVPLIHSNHKQGGALAAKMLIDAGCKNVIQFSGYKMVHTPAHERHIEFERICKSHGLQVTTIETAWNEFNYDYYHMIAKKYLTPQNNYDGVFTADVAAACCLNVLKSQGKNIPQDASIVGYDGIAIAEFTDPPLTSIKQDMKRLSQTCVNTMIKMIDGRTDYERHQILPVSIREGGTVKNR